MSARCYAIFSWASSREIHILHHAAQAPVCGLALIEELRRHSYELSPGTLYLVLHGLEEAGSLARQDRVVGGKVRKYYTATPAGRQALVEVRAKVRELVDEVVEAHGPAALPNATEPAGTGDGEDEAAVSRGSER